MMIALTLLLACQDSTSSQETVPTPKKETSTQTSQATKPVKEDSTPASSVAELDPKKATKTAPDSYDVLFETSQGNIVIEVQRSWAPLGADRFYNLVEMGYFTDVAFFRAIKGFMTQFGIHGDPNVAKMWRSARIEDDSVTQSNLRGYLTFATSGKNSRTTQMFINTSDNINLDAMGFSPIGKVSEKKGGGMKVMDSLYMGYGEGAPRGRGPNQGYIQQQGNTYLKDQFPKLDYIKSARVCHDDCE